MSKFLMLLLVSSSLLLSACGKDNDDKKGGGGNSGRVFTKGDFPNERDTLYGSWRAPDRADNGIVFQERYNFNRKGDLGFETDCITPRGRVTVAFVVSARIDVNTIEITEGAKKTESINGMNCTISVEPAKFNYIVNGNALTFVTLDGRDSYALTRVP